MDAEQFTIKTPISMHPDAEAFFRSHGCHIVIVNEYREITFPAGTTREESWPRPPQSTIYKLILPDGAEALEQYVRHLGMSVLYYLS
jgi:hypothetical protein